MIKSKIRKGDTVIVICGDDKGKQGEVLMVQPVKGRILVKGVNLKKKAVKKSNDYPNGGFVESEYPVHISNVQLLCSKTGKGVRVGIDTDKDGKKIRVARKAGLDFKFD